MFLFWGKGSTTCDEAAGCLLLLRDNTHLLGIACVPESPCAPRELVCPQDDRGEESALSRATGNIAVF